MPKVIKARIERLKRTRYRIKRSGIWVFCQSDTPGCQRVTVQAETWSLVYEENGKRVRKDLGVREKTVAQILMNKFITTGEYRAVGLQDDHAEHDRLPFAEVLAEYLRERERDGNAGEKYLADVRRTFTRFGRAAGFQTLADVDRRVLEVIAESGTAAKTRNLCVGYWRPFGAWLVKKGYRGKNLFEELPSFRGPKVHERFALDHEDLARLLQAARDRPTTEARIYRRGSRRGQQGARVKGEYLATLELQGEGRALLYEFACLTGLRVSEIARIRGKHLRLTGDRPAVELEGGPNRKQKDWVWHPLPLGLAAKLAHWVEKTGRAGEDRLFRFQADKVSVILNKDLLFAGLPKRDGRGRVFDFHSFRHCTASYLALAGVSPAEAQVYMRHKDIRLTMDVYRDKSLSNVSATAAAMPRF